MSRMPLSVLLGSKPGLLLLIAEWLRYKHYIIPWWLRRAGLLWANLKLPL
jgi:hypothetical protein